MSIIVSFCTEQERERRRGKRGRGTHREQKRPPNMDESESRV